jgi:hypothetical protein
MRYAWLVPLFVSASALAFLVYTLANLSKLGIGLLHPRVLLEFGIFIVFLAIALYIKSGC